VEGERQCLIVVEDNGIGFDERDRQRIFSPFERLNARGTYGGSGIGLAICKRIAARHGGDVTAYGTPGKGSTFVVSLPVGQRMLEPVG
jgi:signal transduction histidine kinase